MSLGENAVIQLSEGDKDVTEAKTVMAIVPELVSCGLGEQKISQRLNIVED